MTKNLRFVLPGAFFAGVLAGQSDGAFRAIVATALICIYFEMARR